MSKRKVVDLSDDEGGVWSSGIVDPNNKEEASIDMHLRNMETFVQALRSVVGKNSDNSETLLKALWKEANDLCKTSVFHKSLRDIVNDVVDDSDDDDESDDEEPPIHSIADPKEKQWSIMFRQLRDYRITNGNCKVPLKYKENPKLGSWVNNQKTKYKNTRKNKSGSKLKPDQITKLESIGMDWGKNGPAPVSWEERFNELVKYKTVRGNCNVRYNETSPTPLAMWVVAQRMEYKRFKKGLDSLLTLDQIKQLNGIGMKWKVPKV